MVITHLLRCTWGGQAFLNAEEFCWYTHKYEYKLFRDGVFSSVRRYLSIKEYVKLDMVHA
jgi:hypothetical protein